jgi:hypothetical protein
MLLLLAAFHTLALARLILFDFIRPNHSMHTAAAAPAAGGRIHYTSTTHPVWLHVAWGLHLEAVEVKFNQRLTTGQMLLLLLLLLLLRLLVAIACRCTANCHHCIRRTVMGALCGKCSYSLPHPGVPPQQRPAGWIQQLRYWRGTSTST